LRIKGTLGAYSEAATRRARPLADTVGLDSFEAVFDSVATGRSSHGTLPVENPVGGSMHRNYDLLLDHDLPIVAETELPIVHNLLTLPVRKAIKRVFSHPQGLAQCERYLKRLPGVELVATYDTAGSARRIRDGNLSDAAAIASLRAAQSFGLQVLEAAIQDYQDNLTRFVLIAREPHPLAPPEKTSITFAAQRNRVRSSRR
jgi:prephenate dehydratase